MVSPWKAVGPSSTASVVPLRDLGVSSTAVAATSGNKLELDDHNVATLTGGASNNATTLAMTAVVTVLSVSGGRSSPLSSLGTSTTSSIQGRHPKCRHAQNTSSSMRLLGPAWGGRNSPTDPFPSGSSSLSMSSSSPDLSRSSRRKSALRHHHHRHHHHHHRHRYKVTHKVGGGGRGQIVAEVTGMLGCYRHRSASCCKCMDKRNACGNKRNALEVDATANVVSDPGSKNGNHVVVNSLYDIEYSLQNEVDTPHRLPS